MGEKRREREKGRLAKCSLVVRERGESEVRERTLEEVLVDDAPIGLGNDHAGPRESEGGR